jgi:hypothetical protein
MADTTTLASIAATVPTVVGVILDWMVPPAMKEKCREKIESKLYWFNYATLRGFGKAEIEFSIRIFAKIVGERLFGMHRAIFVCAVAACLWGVFLCLGIKPLARVYLNPAFFFQILLSFFFFSISLSWTIWLSRFALKVRGGATLLGSLVLLIIHLLAYLLWHWVMIFALGLIGNLANVIWGGAPLGKYWHYLQGFTSDIGSILQEDFDRWDLWALYNDQQVSLEDLYREDADPRERRSAINLLVEQGLSHTTLFLRLALAAFFIAGSIYVRFFRRLLIWFWSALVHSKSVFTPPLSAVSAGIALIAKWPDIVSAIRSAFS